jgi:REP element-mobilizing transposase RayT
VQDALEFFAGKRYENLAWCVMPNHVHWMLRPQPDWSLPEIMDSVKTFTARTINKLTGRTGNSLWMREYYDHLIRDSHDFLHGVRYIVANPAEAGIVNWPWVYFDPQLSSVI